MYGLLAQAADQLKGTPIEIISEGVSKGVEHGLKVSAENATTNWILMVTVVAITSLGVWAITWAINRFLKTLQEVNVSQNDRDTQYRQHVRDLAAEFNLWGREARTENAAHAKEIVGLSKESAVLIHSAAAELRDVTKDTKIMVHDVRGILHEHRGALDMALYQLGKPTVNQLFNIPSKPEKTENET